MPRYIRPQMPGASVFFTVNLVDRTADMLVREVAVLRAAVAVTKAKRPFVIDAWVVLPNHMHCIWTLPAGDADYSGRWREIKGQFSTELGRAGRAPTSIPQNPYGAVGGRARVGSHPYRRDEVAIWQKRFWEHHIRSDAEFAASVRYCWNNPVKHGLVDHPRDWPYSSWHRDAGGAAS